MQQPHADKSVQQRRAFELNWGQLDFKNLSQLQANKFDLGKQIPQVFVVLRLKWTNEKRSEIIIQKRKIDLKLI